jgi:dolichol-phosphate mannosyltransferase
MHLINYKDWAVISPLANEEPDFPEFAEAITAVLNYLGSGKVYLIVDKASKDNTYKMCCELAERDSRFVAVWAPENRNVVDAYMRGFREAVKAGHEIIIEMDAGLSHDPRAIPMFLRVLNEGNECAFGSRFVNGGSMADSAWNRKVLSRVGTLLSNVLLGTTMADMTSGFQGFHREILVQLLKYPLRSKAHFYQTEVRYLLRKTRYAEVPIHYRAPSKSVSKNAIKNALATLWHYFTERLKLRAPAVELKLKSNLV